MAGSEYHWMVPETGPMVGNQKKNIVVHQKKKIRILANKLVEEISEIHKSIMIIKIDPYFL